MSKHITTNLAYLRLARGKLSQRDVANATGITQKTISSLETGTSKGIEFNTLSRLCSFFRCEPNEILILEDIPDEVKPSEESLKKADELIARGLKAAMDAPGQTTAKIWAQFDAACQRLRQQQPNPARKQGA